MTDIKSMTMEELKNLMTEIGEKPFRAKQIYAWLHQQLVTSWDEMTNLSKSLREKLSVYPITALSQADVRISKIDGTRKYLFQLEDGNVIESSYEISSRKLCMYFLTGRVPYGLPVLCFYHRRPDQMPETFRDAGPDLPDTGRYRRTGGKRGSDGNR